MSAPKIPGWNYVSEDELDGMTPEEYTTLDVQIVNGHYYVSQTAGSLQMLVDEWIDAVKDAYLNASGFVDGKWVPHNSTGTDMRKKLQEWGLVDDRGRVIEE